MITNEIYFFKNQSSVSTSGSLYNVNDGTLILQVDGDVSNLELSVLGNTDLIDDDFVTLKTINASDYSMSDKITSTGIYWIDINGIRKIKLNLSKITGSVNVKAITKRGLTTDLVARAMAANAAAGGGDYYTKEETDNKLDNKQDKINRFYIVDCKNTLGDSFDEIMNIYDTDILNQLTNIMNECYTNGYKSIAILFSGKNSFIAYARHGSDFSTQRYNYYLYGYLNLEDTSDIDNTTRIYTRIVRTEINGTWNNNVFTTSGLFLKFGSSFIVPDTSQVLTKTNTKSYTPTNDYNPATKKYVDDAVASAGGGDNIYKMYISIYSYTLLSSDINSSTIFLTSYADEFTKFINSIGDGNGALLYLYGSLNASTQSYYMVPQGYMFTLASEGKSIVNKTTIKFVSSYVVTNAITALDNRAAVKIYTLNINGTWTDNVFTCTSAAIYISNRFLLPTNNTTDYTPTSDYNPATKKYVDDSIASAITTSLEGSY